MVRKYYYSLYLSLTLLSCSSNSNSYEMDFLSDGIAGDTPIEFKPYDFPDDKIIHKGIFSPDLDEYYYTVSNKRFEKFDVYRLKKENGSWSKPEPAFFNSIHSDHGMSFSPDGNTVYFSSTRPTQFEGIHETWHIWNSVKVNGKWTEPEFVDIPNMREKLVSHPTITNSGTLYFHSSNLDYSEMDLYQSIKINDEFKEAKRVSISMNSKSGKCTPFISPKEDYLIFASIGNQLDLMISFNDGDGNWINTRKLNDKINELGQGNPYVTADNKFLFYTTGGSGGEEWKIKWVDIQSELKIE